MQRLHEYMHAHSVKSLIAKRVMCAVYIYFAEPACRGIVWSPTVHKILTDTSRTHICIMLNTYTYEWHRCKISWNFILCVHICLSVIIFEFCRNGVGSFSRENWKINMYTDSDYRNEKREKSAFYGDTRMAMVYTIWEKYRHGVMMMEYGKEALQHIIYFYLANGRANLSSARRAETFYKLLL